MIKLTSLLSEYTIQLKPVEAHQTKFGKAYNSPLINGPHKYYLITVTNRHGVVGEIEYGDVDDNTLEVVSIHLDRLQRGKNYGAEAFSLLMETEHKSKAVLMVTPTSKKFWMKLGFTPMKDGPTNYYEKRL